jgi:hypothetical protein
LLNKGKQPNKKNIMKKITLFSVVLSIVGFVSAQSVTSSDFVTNIAKYNGITVTITDVKGSIKSSGNSNTTVIGSNKAPSSTQGSIQNGPTAKAANPTTSNATQTPSTGSTTTAKNTVNQTTSNIGCTAPSGYKLVDFTFAGSTTVGCYLIPSNLVKLFTEVSKTGKKMNVVLTVDTTTKLHKIKSILQQ